LLREQDEAVWSEAFSDAAFVSSTSAFVLQQLPKGKNISMRSVRAMASRHLANPSTKTQAALHRAAGKVASLLREADPDQAIVSALLGSIEDDHHAGSPTRNERDNYCGRIRERQREANRTRNLFVTSNLGLVVSVAKRYRFSEMPLIDRIQEGNLGLLRAVARFDERKGFRFSTYATWWIRHAVGRGISDKSRAVRVPVHVTEARQKLAKHREELFRELGREPTRDEVATRARVSVRKLEKTVLAAGATTVSLNAPASSDSERARIDVFTNDSTESAYDRMSMISVSRRAHAALQTLAPIEIEILHRRFGLAGKSATTLQEIANHIGKSRERIRQIQEKALEKLRTQLQLEHAI